LNCDKCPIEKECEELELKAENFCPIIYVVKRYLQREIAEAKFANEMEKLKAKLEGAFRRLGG